MWPICSRICIRQFSHGDIKHETEWDHPLWVESYITFLLDISFPFCLPQILCTHIGHHLKIRVRNCHLFIDKLLQSMYSCQVNNTVYSIQWKYIRAFHGEEWHQTGLCPGTHFLCHLLCCPPSTCFWWEWWISFQSEKTEVKTTDDWSAD